MSASSSSGQACFRMRRYPFSASSRLSEARRQEALSPKTTRRLRQPSWIDGRSQGFFCLTRRGESNTVALLFKKARENGHRIDDFLLRGDPSSKPYRWSPWKKGFAFAGSAMSRSQCRQRGKDQERTKDDKFTASELTQARRVHEGST